MPPRLSPLATASAALVLSACQTNSDYLVQRPLTAIEQAEYTIVVNVLTTMQWDDEYDWGATNKAAEDAIQSAKNAKLNDEVFGATYVGNQARVTIEATADLSDGVVTIFAFSSNPDNPEYKHCPFLDATSLADYTLALEFDRQSSSFHFDSSCKEGLGDVANSIVHEFLHLNLNAIHSEVLENAIDELEALEQNGGKQTEIEKLEVKIAQLQSQDLIYSLGERYGGFAQSAHERDLAKVRIEMNTITDDCKNIDYPTEELDARVNAIEGSVVYYCERGAHEALGIDASECDDYGAILERQTREYARSHYLDIERQNDRICEQNTAILYWPEVRHHYPPWIQEEWDSLNHQEPFSAFRNPYQITSGFDIENPRTWTPREILSNDIFVGDTWPY